MEIVIGISLGLIIACLSVSFYCLGVSHGRAVKDGSTVKFEPHRHIVRAIKKHKEVKEADEKQDEFLKQIKEVFEYDGRPKKNGVLK